MFGFKFVDMAAITQQYSLNIGAMRRHFSSREMFPVSQTEGEEGLMFLGRAEVIFKRSSNLYCRLDLGRVLMVGTKVSKGFFV